MYPYACCIYDGKKYAFFYLSDYLDSDELLRSAVKYLMNNKYNGYVVYLHNFSKFDGVFLTKILRKLSIIKKKYNILKNWS